MVSEKDVGVMHNCCASPHGFDGLFSGSMRHPFQLIQAEDLNLSSCRDMFVVVPIDPAVRERFPRGKDEFGFKEVFGPLDGFARVCASTDCCSRRVNHIRQVDDFYQISRWCVF
jgi:hypothetical protein